MKQKENKLDQERRDFLKKAAYRTPTIYILGSLVNPANVCADSTGGPSGPPGNGYGYGSGSGKSVTERPTRPSTTTP